MFLLGATSLMNETLLKDMEDAFKGKSYYPSKIVLLCASSWEDVAP